MSESRHISFVVAVTLSLVVASAALGQMQIKVNDNVNVKFGILMQSQGDALQDAATRSYAQNVFIRRARLLLGGQISPNLTFFVETDSPNVGNHSVAMALKASCLSDMSCADMAGFAGQLCQTILRSSAYNFY